MSDPRIRLGLLWLLGVWVLLVDSPRTLLVLSASVVAGFLMVVRGPWRLRAIFLMTTVVWSTVVSQGLFYAELPRTELISIGPLTIWREGVTWGALQSLRLVTMTFAGLTVAMSTAPDRLFAALLALRIPYVVAFSGVIALRFVPETGRELLAVRTARARRGRPLWKRSPWSWLTTEVAMIRPVVARSVRRARRLAESLDARGFDPKRARRLRRPLRAPSGELAVLGGVSLITVGMLGLQVLQWLYLAELYYNPHLRPLYGLARHWL